MSEVVSNKALADKDAENLKDSQVSWRRSQTDETKEESGRSRGGRVSTRGGKSVKQHIRREDGLFAPLGLPIKHLAVDGLCYAPACREELVKNRWVNQIFQCSPSFAKLF